MTAEVRRWQRRNENCGGGTKMAEKRRRWRWRDEDGCGDRDGVGTEDGGEAERRKWRQRDKDGDGETKMVAEMAGMKDAKMAESRR